MTNRWWIFAALFAFAPWAGAEIFKCNDAKGNVKYQNFPCQIDSIGSRATAAPPKMDEPARGRAAATSPQNMVVKTADLLPDMAYDEPRIGMTQDQVKMAWGDPSRIETSEGEEGLIEIWHYGDIRTVQFDRKGRVFAVEQ